MPGTIAMAHPSDWNIPGTIATGDPSAWKLAGTIAASAPSPWGGSQSRSAVAELSALDPSFIAGGLRRVYDGAGPPVWMTSVGVARLSKRAARCPAMGWICWRRCGRIVGGGAGLHKRTLRARGVGCGPFGLGRGGAGSDLRGTPPLPLVEPGAGWARGFTHRGARRRSPAGYESSCR